MVEIITGQQRWGEIITGLYKLVSGGREWCGMLVVISLQNGLPLVRFYGSGALFVKKGQNGVLEIINVGPLNKASTLCTEITWNQ